MVDPSRLELLTSCVSSRRSNQLSYGSKLSAYVTQSFCKYRVFNGLMLKALLCQGSAGQ